MADFRKEINKLAKALGEDWTREQSDVLKQISFKPDRWRVIVEQPGETNQWNYPVCIIEFVVGFDRNSELDDAAGDWEQLWWACDNTADYSFRGLREDEKGDLWVLIGDENIGARLARESSGASWHTLS